LHVVLEADPLADAQFGFIVTLLALIIDQGARGADAEIAALNSGAKQICAAPTAPGSFRDQVKAAAMAMQTRTPDAAAQSVIDDTHKVLIRRAANKLTLKATQNPTGAAHANGGRGTSSGAKSRRVQFLRQVAGLRAGAPVPGLSAAAKETAPGLSATATHEEIADAVAEGVTQHASNQSGVFYLASLLTRPRAQLAIDLAALPVVADRGDIALFTPALIDFSFWLAENAADSDDPHPTLPPKGVTPLVAQIAVMSDIAAKTCNHVGIAGGFAVHPFVSFCPWRQIAEEEAGIDPAAQQISLVKDAILSQGFIGIKIYPLMGFRPIGNAAVAVENYPARLRLLNDWANRMDNALEQLYRWCVANDVPIMAHCSFSQYPSVSGGLLGGPDGWLEVLSRPGLKNLRLNLAHCGGVWDLSAQRRKQLDDKIPIPWSNKVIGALGNPLYPNLYADLADYSDVLLCQKLDFPPSEPEPLGGDASTLVALARLVAKNPPARRRIMYGTDYMFLIQSPRTENYVASMRDCLAPGLGMEKTDLMGGNAARFLGLNNPASGTRQRLDKFRGDTFLARWELR
jgi:hypothetical protein